MIGLGLRLTLNGGREALLRLIITALGVTWTLHGLEVTLSGAVSGVLHVVIVEDVFTPLAVPTLEPHSTMPSLGYCLFVLT